MNNEFATITAEKGPAAAASGLSNDPGSTVLATAADPKAKRAADTLTSTGTPGTNAYKIGPLDVVEFSVFKVPELSRTAQVADTGTINLPLLGEVQASGRTAQELERELTAKLGAKYLQNPQVTLFIREYNSQRVTVEGAVKKPGVYPVRGRTTLIELVATAGGLESVSDSTLVIFRQINGKRAAAKFDFDEIRAGQAQDPVILASDIVVAPTSMTKETFNNILKALPLTSAFAWL